MIGLVSLALLSAELSPSSMVVLLGRRTGTSVAEGGALTAKVASALSAHGVSVSMNPVEASAALKRLGFPDASRCSGQRACLVELGRQLGVAWVVSVSVTSIKQERSVGVELIAVADGSSPEKDAVLLLPKAELTPDLLASFASRVKNRWTPIEQPPPMVALAEPTVALEVSHPVELPTPPAPEPRTQAASWVLGGAGLAALVASGVLLGSALVTRGGIYEPGTDSLGRRVSSLTFEEATARNMQANTAFIFSAALGALAAVLGLTAVVLW